MKLILTLAFFIIYEPNSPCLDLFKIDFFPPFWLAGSKKLINDINWMILIWCSSKGYYNSIKRVKILSSSIHGMQTAGWKQETLWRTCQSTFTIFEFYFYFISFHWPPNEIDSLLKILNVSYREKMKVEKKLNKRTMSNQSIICQSFWNFFLTIHIERNAGNLKNIKNWNAIYNFDSTVEKILSHSIWLLIYIVTCFEVFDSHFFVSIF